MRYTSRLRRIDFDEGSRFSEADDFTHTRVAFIGADVKKKLFLRAERDRRKHSRGWHFLSGGGRAQARHQ